MSEPVTPLATVEVDPFEDQIVLKLEPELRHVCAHFFFALEALAHGRPVLALENLRSIESLIMSDGNDANWEQELRSLVAKRGERDGDKEKEAE